MEAREKILTLIAVPWCEDAARYLAGTLRRAPCFTVEDYRREIEGNPDARLLRVSDGEQLVGFVVLHVVRYMGGTEGVISAAAGRLPGVDLTAQVLPALERMFQGVRAFRVSTARKGLVRKLAPAGYALTHYTLRKLAPC